MIIPSIQSEASALVARAGPLVARYSSRTCRNSYGQYTSCSSSWSTFGRWILVGVLILAALFVLFIYLCCMRRRRSRASKNSTPMTTTNTGYNNSNNNNNNGYNSNNGNAYGGNNGYDNAPAYGGQGQYAPPKNPPQQQYSGQDQYAPPSEPPPQQYGGSNEGYYGQQNGVTQPQGAYMK